MLMQVYRLLNYFHPCRLDQPPEAALNDQEPKVQQGLVGLLRYQVMQPTALIPD